MWDRLLTLIRRGDALADSTGDLIKLIGDDVTDEDPEGNVPGLPKAGALGACPVGVPWLGWRVASASADEGGTGPCGVESLWVDLRVPVDDVDAVWGGASVIGVSTWSAARMLELEASCCNGRDGAGL
jgi:hypothetical protein